MGFFRMGRETSQTPRPALGKRTKVMAVRRGDESPGRQSRSSEERETISRGGGIILGLMKEERNCCEAGGEELPKWGKCEVGKVWIWRPDCKKDKMI